LLRENKTWLYCKLGDALKAAYLAQKDAYSVIVLGLFSC
jgi:hypothetical protein